MVISEDWHTSIKTYTRVQGEKWSCQLLEFLSRAVIDSIPFDSYGDMF